MLALNKHASNFLGNDRECDTEQNISLSTTAFFLAASGHVINNLHSGVAKISSQIRNRTLWFRDFLNAGLYKTDHCRKGGVIDS
jgi:hypothetical protein